MIAVKLNDIFSKYTNRRNQDNHDENIYLDSVNYTGLGGYGAVPVAPDA
jgi:hypothetical protein